MPYTVVISGVSIQCDTAEEAIGLARLNIGADSERKADTKKPNGSDSSVAGSRWSEQRVSELFKIINTNQRKFLDALLDQPDGRTEDQILQMLGLNSPMALAGVTTALYKNAKKVGADPRDLYDRKQITIGDSITNDYVIRESFRRAAKSRIKD